MSRIDRTSYSLAAALALLACTARPAAEAEIESASAGVLIEAEDFVARTPEVPGVPRPHDDASASGRTALVRFNRVERAVWRFRTPARESGRQDVWLRYAARGAPTLRWSIDDGDWREARVPATGAFEGERAWGWALLGTIDARPDERSLALAGAGIRPDCFMVAPAGGAAPDWPPVTATAPDLAPAVLERLRTIPPRAEATWLAASEAARLPDWVERQRVSLHTRLSVAWVDEPIFVGAASAARSLGAPALVRHVKAMNGECYWPSAFGAVADWVGTADESDPVRGMARRAHGAGLAFVAYYRHQEDRPLAREHPDWVTRDVQGRTIRRAWEPRLCFHSPFGEVTLQRLRELAERGADAIYLDESHQPLKGCWCEWTRAAFMAETGLPLPESARADDALYRRFVEFTEDSLARELWRWRETLRAEFPGLVLFVSTHRQPDPLGARPTLRLASAADIVKTEFASSVRPSLAQVLGRDPRAEPPPPTSTDALLAAGWAMARDGAFGRPPHVWVSGLDGAARWRAATGALVASGCCANLDHPEGTLPDAASFAEAFRLGRELSSPMAGARPLGRVLLHLPERLPAAIEREPAAAWAAAGGPFSAAWQALLGAHLPVRIVSDDQLEAGLLGDASVLHLPSPRLLNDAQRAAVEAFAARGGVAVEGELDALLAAASALGSSVDVHAPARATVHWFRAADGALVLGLSNEVAWVLDPRAEAPPPVRGTWLELDEGVRRVTVWPGGAELTIETVGAARRVDLPAFQEALTVKVER